MEKYKEVSTEDLKQWIDEKKDFVLLDVLVQDSYEARHVPTAKSAPVSEADFLDKVAESVSGKEDTVVVYCSSSTCGASPQAAAKLVEAGYTNVYDYEGGLADWQNAGYSFEGKATKD